jgi:hypothetical protein
MVPVAQTRIQYTATGRRLTATGSYGYATGPVLARISVLGVSPAPTTVTVNGAAVPFTYTGQLLQLTSLTLSMNADFVVAW